MGQLKRITFFVCKDYIDRKDRGVVAFDQFGCDNPHLDFYEVEHKNTLFPESIC